MLDKAEVEAFELWKELRLTTSTDLSIDAYNAEMEGLALAWEAGAKAASGPDRLPPPNPYRGRGTTGEIRP